VLYEILEKAMDGSKVLIFTGTKRTADSLTWALRRDGWPARAIHGDKSQTERDWVLKEFRNGKVPLMIATDVAARGLDVKDIKTVINYDFPAQIEDYVHRIGRTGRAGEVGLAISFFTLKDAKKSKSLIEVLRQNKQPVPQDLYKFVQIANTVSSHKERTRWKRPGFGPRIGTSEVSHNGYNSYNTSPANGYTASHSTGSSSYSSQDKFRNSSTPYGSEISRSSSSRSPYNSLSSSSSSVSSAKTGTGSYRD